MHGGGSSTAQPQHIASDHPWTTRVVRCKTKEMGYIIGVNDSANIYTTHRVSSKMYLLA